jgi:hypothetical protein
MLSDSCPVCRLWPVAAALLLALTLAACGGGSGPSPTPEATATLDPNASPLDLERFHYVAELRLLEQEGDRRQLLISTEGDYVSPDRHAFAYVMRAGDQELRRSVVVIGDQAWYRQADEPWRATMQDDPQLVDVLAAAFTPLRPGFLGGQAFQQLRESIQRLPSTEEVVNRIDTNRYRVGPAGLEYFSTFLVDEQFLQSVQDVSWDVWLAQEGVRPVRIRAAATVTADLRILKQLDLKAPVLWEIQVDISKPNSEAIVVEAPEDRD